MVERKIYMDKIKKLQDQQIIKVVTGVRRCGKSTLLRQFQSYLLNTGVEQEQIIAINFEDVENEGLLDYHALHSYVTERLVPGKMTYIFLDEVQAVPNFQKAVDSLFLRENTDIGVGSFPGFSAAANALSTPPGEYDRKVETHRVSRMTMSLP